MSTYTIYVFENWQSSIMTFKGIETAATTFSIRQRFAFQKIEN
jgi:hypothetical protein